MAIGDPNAPEDFGRLIGGNPRNIGRKRSRPGHIGDRARLAVKVPGEYAEFRLKDGRFLGEVMGESFFGPETGAQGGRPISDSERQRLRDGNYPLARIVRENPRFRPRPETEAGRTDRLVEVSATPPGAPAGLGTPSAPEIPGGDFEAEFVTLPTGPEESESVEPQPSPNIRARPRPVRTPDLEVPFHMSSPVEDFPRLRNDDPARHRGDPEFGARRVRRRTLEDGTIAYQEYEHRGLDIAAPPGATIRSPVSGTVRLGFPYGDSDPELAGYRIVWIERDDGDEVGLFYVSPYDEDGNVLVRAGDRVKAGAIVGTMQDRAAISPGMENHFHLKVIQNGDPIDPAPWLERWRREIQREEKWYGR